MKRGRPPKSAAGGGSTKKGSSSSSNDPLKLSSLRANKRTNLGVGDQDDFAFDQLRIVLGQVLMLAGFERTQLRTADVLGEIMYRYLQLLATNAKSFAENAGRTDTNLEDVGQVLFEMGVKAEDLHQFAKLWLKERQVVRETRAAETTRDETGDGGSPAGQERAEEDEMNRGKDIKGKGKPREDGTESMDGVEGGDATGEGAGEEELVPLTAGNALGEFMRLPPGPFPISLAEIRPDVASAEQDGPSDSDEVSTKRRRRLSNAEDWMPPLPDLPEDNVVEGAAPGAEASSSGKDMDIDGAGDGSLAKDPLFMVIPFEQSQLAATGRPVLLPDPIFTEAIEKQKGINDPLKTMKDLDDALSLAMEATRIPHPGPIGHPFEAIRNPDAFWNPTKGPPLGVGFETLGRANVALAPRLAPIVRELLVRPVNGHLSGASTAQAALADIAENDGADLGPASWDLPFHPFFYQRQVIQRQLQLQQQKKWGRGGGTRGGGRGRGRGGTGVSGFNTPRAASPPPGSARFSPPYSARTGMYSPVLQGGPGNTDCVCTGKYRYTEFPDGKGEFYGQIECDNCKRWCHVNCVKLTKQEEEADQWFCPRCKGTR